MFRELSAALVPARISPETRVPTGMPGLDTMLDGGLPRGQILEISGASSSGKSTLAFGAALSLLREGESVAWIDPTRSLWPLAALEERLPLGRLLVVRVKDGMSALKAAHLVLSCKGAVAAAIVTLPPGFQPAETNLVKLQRLAEASSSALVFVTERAEGKPSLAACVALRLCVRRQLRGRNPSLVVEIARHKRGPTSARVEETYRGPDRLRVRSTL